MDCNDDLGLHGTLVHSMIAIHGLAQLTTMIRSLARRRHSKSFGAAFVGGEITLESYMRALIVGFVVTTDNEAIANITPGKAMFAHVI